jgi:uncharacterized protein (TIGR00369 family)
MSGFSPLPPEAYAEMSGLEALERIIAGEFPAAPIAEGLNFALVEVSHGVAVFAGEALAAHRNPHGTVHGGWAATILDSALGCAVHTTLQPRERYTTIEMKVNYLRPILAGETGRLVCRGRVIQRGRTIALSEANLVDAAGKVYAHATETCMIFPPPDASVGQRKE